ncbi:MAG: DUF6600 domain-containing protein [Thermoanaerobaculia bacterium]|nr:DUF6600 domain-containing protein [Thermoanaerobaculia bacterium]
MTRTLFALGAALGTSALLVVPAAGAEDDRGAYGYFRTVEGSATVYGLDESYPVEENRPLLTDDRVQTRFGDRVEAVLPDGTRVRIGQDSEVLFDQMAYSADEWAETTLLYLDHGELTITVPEERRTRGTVRVDAPNASFYLDSSGTYTFEARGYVTQAIVRRGRAEILTRQGEYRLRAGEHVWLEGMEYPQVELRRAGSRSELERWAYDLDLEADRYRDSEYVDGTLGYSTSRLYRYGSWHRRGDRTFWRPTGVGSGWRPYDDGYWTHTPSGLTWVSYEPWGWATYHYGTWDYLSGYGWVWYPGTRYAPAWVYWYWGPRYVGWCPIGYYTSYYYGYPRYDRGFRFGVHGWAGGHWGHYDRWNFVDVDHFDDHRLARHTRTNRALRESGAELGRGIVTTDTRPLDRDALRDPRRAVRILQDRPAAGTRPGSGQDLPDVTEWVARKREIPGDMQRIAMPVVEGSSPGDTRGGERAGEARRRVMPDDRRPPTRGDDGRGRTIRSRTPSEGLSAPRRTGPAARAPESDARPRVVPRTRSGERSSPRSDPEVRSRAPDRGRTDAGPEVRWRTRSPEVRPERDEAGDRRLAPRSSSPARRVLERVRSDRYRGPETRDSSSRPDRRPGVSSRARPRSRSSTRSSPSSSRRSTRASPSSQRSRPSSTKSRSSGSRSRSQASSRSGSSSRSSGSKSRGVRRKSDPDR